jgi:prophage regulatory protein
MVRQVLRKRDVLAATGWSNSTLYTKIIEGKFPRGTKIDPDGHAVIWWADEVEEFQKRAVLCAAPPAPKKNLDEYFKARTAAKAARVDG